MNVLIFKDSEEATEKAYEIVKSRFKNGLKTLGLATGSTPLKLYKKIRTSGWNMSHVSTVNLDEYMGLGADNPQSYNYYMQEELFKYMNFKSTNLPNGIADDLQKECERYEQTLKENPVDLQILGIGSNGHIGFNEPGTPFDSITHVVELTPSTREANKRFFEKDEEVPSKAITMGISSIMAAKEIIMLALGEEKADAIKQMAEGPVTIECPASVLQNHRRAWIILDEGAACKLKRK